MEKDKDNITYFSVTSGKTFKRIQILVRTCDDTDDAPGVFGCYNYENHDVGTFFAVPNEIKDELLYFVVSADANAALPEILRDVFPWQLVDESVAQLLVYLMERDGVDGLDYYYDSLVSALVRLMYSEDKIEAIVCNILDETITEENKAEWQKLQAYRKECKQKAKDYIQMAKGLTGTNE